MIKTKDKYNNNNNLNNFRMSSVKVSNKVRTIQIPVNQISILVGESEYGSLIEILLKLLVKVNFSLYSNKILELETKYNKSFKELSDLEIFNNLKNDLGLDDKEVNIRNILNGISSNDISDKNILEIEKTKIIEKINKGDNSSLTSNEIEDKKGTLVNILNSFSNRYYGYKNEKSAIDIYSDITGYTLSDFQKTITYNLTPTTENKKIDDILGIKWVLKGKIDGIAKDKSDNSIIIEVKNRVKALFGELKNYEKPQIQIYLKLFNINKGHLVEYLKQNQQKQDNQKNQKNQKNQINIIEVSFDYEYWKTIKSRLHKFITFFYDFMKDDILLEQLLINGKYHKETENILRNKLKSYF
jgi:hypothetical protein